MVVSSANSASSVVQCFGMSWVNMLYNAGDSTAPCGTPNTMSWSSEVAPLIVTWNCRPEEIIVLF